MANSANAEAAAIRLAELSREIDDLEEGRAGLLRRVDRMRADLNKAGQRTATMRASVALLVEHISNLVASMAELRALEEELQDLNQGINNTDKEATATTFEIDSLTDTVAEAEDELERISAILFEGKVRFPRGH